MICLSDMRIKLFADGADFEAIKRLAGDPKIKGFTTNPTLMRKSGVTDYEKFSKEILMVVTDKPISFEVLSDELKEIVRQARKVAGWGKNVNVKVPIVNSKGISNVSAIKELSSEGIKLNVTAVFSLGQVFSACQALRGGAPSIVSVFAGRIADAGQDPIPHMKAARAICREAGSGIELLWASPRESLNIIHAEEAGADIITVTPDLLSKMKLFGKDLEEFSMETSLMFKNDGEKAGYVL